ncbi:zf-HC2 domain-containing protein [candidate division KSB1 bacterium]|nr:zf-HC2 domain-containing protein [candidate division KSB1 bacterium]
MKIPCNIKNREQLINDYLMGALTADEKEQLDEHCFSCDACFDELRFQQEMTCLIRDEGQTLFADYLIKRQVKPTGLFDAITGSINFNWSPQWAYGAVALGIFILIYGLFIHQSSQLINRHIANHTPRQEIVTDTTMLVQHQSTQIQTPTAKSPEQNVASISNESQQALMNMIERALQDSLDVKPEMQDAFAANFEPTPYLETMVSDATRSSSLNVLSPGIGDQVKSPIIFQWRSGDVPVAAMKILNNRGAEILRLVPKSDSLVVDQKLNPGLYYWKLESDDDLLFLGKFFISKKK